MEKTTGVNQHKEGRVRVLVVDDHPSTAATLARAISHLGNGIDALPATSGKQALKHAHENAIDILITDMMMPEMNGLELIEHMQSHPAGRPACTILMTAYDVPGLKETARRLNIQEILIKPVPPERINKIVSQILDVTEMTDQQTIKPDTQEPYTILIADDYPDNVSLLSRYLKNEGYRFITAQDGIQTLERARTDLPDLILLDVNMPGKDGIKVVQELRADPAIEHIPVIILTAARVSPSDMQYGLNLGADDYITKPFDRLELLARIRTKLRVKKYEDAIRRRNRELNILPEIGRELTARLDLHEVSELVLRRTVEAMGAMSGHIIILNSKIPVHKEYHITSPLSPAGESKLPPLNELIEHIKENRTSILINDSLADPRWSQARSDPARSAVIAPMFGRFELIGLFVLVHERPSYFSADHLSLLQAIASQASIAIENARLYAEVAREQERTSAILTHAADAILMFDKDGSLLMVNPAAEKLFTDYEAKLGMPLAHGFGYDDFIQTLETAFETRKSTSTEIHWPDKRIFSALFTPLDGGGCVVLMHDVSHFKALEQVKNEFIATASHDLRNPITSIKGYSQLIQQAGTLNEPQADFVLRIQNASTHMAELVENMLDLAKMDLGIEIKTEEIELTSLLEELTNEFKPQADAKGQVLTFEKAEARVTLRGDLLQLRQAFRNLIGNAIKYTPENGAIGITMAKGVNAIHVFVRDTGYGIPASDLPHIFDRFYRVRNNGHDDIEGNGLGLAIVKSIAEGHGGNVSVESEVGKGTCFKFHLPIVQGKSS